MTADQTLYSNAGQMCDVVHKVSRNEAPRNSKSNSKIRHSRIVVHRNSPDAAQSRRANRSDGCRLLEAKPALGGRHTIPNVWVHALGVFLAGNLHALRRKQTKLPSRLGRQRVNVEMRGHIIGRVHHRRGRGDDF